LAEDRLKVRYEKMVEWLDEHREELEKNDPAELASKETTIANIKETLEGGDRIRSSEIIIRGSHDY
jgi:hypothetical protein